MAFTLREALWLHGHGLRDLLVAYPTADRGALRELAADAGAAANITLMVDDPAQLDLADAAAGEGAAPLRVCLDLDTSWRPLRRAAARRRAPLPAAHARAGGGVRAARRRAAALRARRA